MCLPLKGIGVPTARGFSDAVKAHAPVIDSAEYEACAQAVDRDCTFSLMLSRLADLSSGENIQIFPDGAVTIFTGLS